MVTSGEVIRIWKKKRKKTHFPTPVLRPMTAATVGIVSAPPVMSRNSVITAVPARIFPIRKNPATAMRAPIVINDKKDAGVHCMSASFLLFQTAFRSFGNVIVISVPLPISLAIFSVPPRNVTPCLTIERPSPVPPIALEWLLSTR